MDICGLVKKRHLRDLSSPGWIQFLPVLVVGPYVPSSGRDRSDSSGSHALQDLRVTRLADVDNDLVAHLQSSWARHGLFSGSAPETLPDLQNFPLKSSAVRQHTPARSVRKRLSLEVKHASFVLSQPDYCCSPGPHQCSRLMASTAFLESHSEKRDHGVVCLRSASTTAFQ
jgi:hypothetical protein